MSNEYKLTQESIALSQNSTWDNAKLEWDLESVFYENESDTCLCGQFPINEICILRNRNNGNTATVGNICVKKFLGLPSDKIFQAIKRIRKDIEKPLNSEAVVYALRRGWINQWESDFYLNIYKKRNLTDKQRFKKLEVNRKLMSGIVNARSSG